MRSDSAKTVLLTLGRLPVALDLARGFSAAGWRVVVAEPFGMHLCRMSKAVDACLRVTPPAVDARAYRRELLQAVKRHAVDLVLPVSEETACVAGLAGELPPGTEIFAPPATDVQRLHDKYSFIEWARGLGLPVPATWLADDPEREQLTAREAFVLKPRDGCSGLGVRFLPPGSEYRAGSDCIVQEQLPGSLVSSFSVARDGRVLATTVYEAAVLSGSVAVCFRRVTDTTVVERWIETFVAGSRHTGFIAFDFVVDDTGVARAIECNPRATSGIHFLRSDALPGLVAGGADTGGDVHGDDALLAESYSCLTAALAATGSGRAATTWRALRDARDVTWRSDDPWPFLLMMVNTWRIVWLAASRRISFAQAAVLDIHWTGRESAP